MDVTRAVLVCVVLCSSAGADSITRDVSANSGIAHDESRASHRLQLLFPLLLRISTRLATLIPTAIAGLVGILLFVAFSKKAFLVSLFALFLIYLDKYKRDDNVVHIHKIDRYNDEEALLRDEEHIHYVWPQHVRRPPPRHRYRPHRRRTPEMSRGIADRTSPFDAEESVSQTGSAPHYRQHPPGRQ